MALVYKLVGFDRTTEALAVVYEIDPDTVARAKRIAGIDDQPGVIVDWPLSRDQAWDISNLIEAKLDTDSMDWALEPYAPPPAASAEGSSNSPRARAKVSLRRSSA